MGVTMETAVITQPDVDEIDAILDHILANPKEWNQRHYGIKMVCGTAFCVAGHALIRAGYTFRPSKPQELCDFYGTTSTSNSSPVYAFFNLDDQMVVASQAAREILGLSWSQHARLFRAENTMADLRLMAIHLREDPTDTLRDWPF